MAIEYKLSYTANEINNKLGQIDDLSEEISSLSSEIVDIKALKLQQTPLFANDISECTDTSKLYVLPDGMIWAYMMTEKEVESGSAYTNLLPLAKATDRTTIYNGKGYKENTKLSGSGGGESTAGSGKEAMCSSGFIFPVAAGDILRIKGVVPVTGSNHYVVGYDSSNARTGNDTIYYANNSDGSLYWIAEGSSGKYTLENNTKTDPSETTIVYTINTAKLGANVNTVRICMGMTENTIVTLNEEIKEGGGTEIVKEYAWANTGHAFVPADYEDRIVTLEEASAEYAVKISVLENGNAINTDYEERISELETQTESNAAEIQKLKDELSAGNSNSGSGNTDTTILYTNQLPLAINADGSDYIGDNGEDGYRKGYRYSASSNAEKAATGFDCLGFIPAKAGDIIRIKNVTQPTASNDGSAYATAYFFTSTFVRTSGTISFKTDATYANGILSFTIPSYDTIAYFKATLIGVSERTIVTVNEEIVETTDNNGNTGTGGGTNSGSSLTEAEKLELIKTWDVPIYDANIPVFQLTTEKAAVTESEKTVASVYAKYDALMAKHPNYITKTNLGMCSDGVTPVYRYDFREPEPHRGITGKKEWSETKAKAIIVSGIHWEWGGIFALYNALEELADNPALFHLRRNTHLIVLPVCNPYAVANMSVRNANLVEIHRNFEVDFIYPGEPGFIEYGERSYGGTEPLSEVETQYIDNIFKANTDAAFFLTCHSNQTDSVYGTGFTWASPATYYMCNMHYRLVDKLSDVWMEKYGDELAAGIADYRTENTPEWDNRLGSAYLSTTNGTETKQATKYGIQATNIEVTDTFVVHGTKANPEPALSSFTISRGAEVYINFLLTAFGVYDHKDKKEYTV